MSSISSPNANKTDLSQIETEALSSPVESPASAVEEQKATSVDDSLPSYLALKYTFFTPKRGDLCGGFCLIFEGETGEALFQTFWVSRSDSLASLKANLDWRTFNKLIPHIGPYDRVWGEKLSSLFSELFPATDRVAFFQAKTCDRAQILPRVAETIRKGYERATHYFLEVSCEYELLTRKELVEASILEEAASEEASSADEVPLEEETSFAGILVQCLPLIDPVRGKAVSELLPGDFLEVQIASGTGAGGLLQQFLKATKQPSIFPVESIEKHEDKIYIYLTINEEMRGLLTLNKDLRLRTKSPLPEKQNKSSGRENFIFFTFLGFALLGFFLAVQYLYR